MTAHWITAVIAIALWLWWARSEWVLAGCRPRRRVRS